MGGGYWSRYTYIYVYSMNIYKRESKSFKAKLSNCWCCTNLPIITSFFWTLHQSMPQAYMNCECTSLEIDEEKVAIVSGTYHKPGGGLWPHHNFWLKNYHFWFLFLLDPEAFKTWKSTICKTFKFTCSALSRDFPAHS